MELGRDLSDTIRRDLLKNLADKEYRDEFVASTLATGIAAQISVMREAREWTQAQLGQKAGMRQTRIHVLEDPAYESYSLNTLRRLASAFDVALIVRFIGFGELVDWIVGLSEDKLKAPDFIRDPVHKRLAEASPSFSEALTLPQRRWPHLDVIQKLGRRQQEISVPAKPPPMNKQPEVLAGVVEGVGATPKADIFPALPGISIQ